MSANDLSKLPGYIPSDEIFGIFKNHLAIGLINRMKISKDKLKQIVREELDSLTVLSERKIKW